MCTQLRAGRHSTPSLWSKIGTINVQLTLNNEAPWLHSYLTRAISPAYGTSPTPRQRVTPTAANQGSPKSAADYSLHSFNRFP